MGDRFFKYDSRETEYLKSRDQRISDVIDQIGHISRPVDTDLFSSVIHCIIGQQISTKAEQTIWKRMKEALGDITPESIDAASREELQSLGMTFRKADYIKEFCHEVMTGEVDLDEISYLPDDEAIKELIKIKGIGVWTAEMILLFCLQRPDVFSFGDLAIRRGLRMVYHHRKITPQLFEKYRRRFSPCCSVASLYLWAVAGGAIPEMRDYAPKRK